MRLAPRHAQAYNNRGVARLALGDRRGAFADYDRALALNPNLAQAYNNRGTARFLAGDLSAALADLEQAIRLDPSYAQAYDNCAAVHDKNWEHAKAAAHYTRALELYSRDRRAQSRICSLLVLRAFALYHLRAIHPALADLRRAYQLDPAFCAAIVAGTIERHARESVAAVIQNCDRHLSENPGDFFAVVRRALTYLVAGRLAEYEADYLAAMQTSFPAADRTMGLDFLETLKQRLTMPARGA